MDIRSQLVTTAAPWVTRAGNYLRLITCPSNVDVTFYNQDGQPVMVWDDVSAGTSGHVEDQNGKIINFSRAIISTSADQTIKIAVGYGTAEVDSVSGTVTVSQGSTAVNDGTVAITDVEAALIAIGSGRKSVRFHNIGTNTVAIGAAGITYAARTIVLAPGDTWIERDAANAAWFGICDTGLTASVNVQTVS